MYSYRPVIIIGAARSGTKMTRDVIARHPGVDRIPFDINYVWRFGNECYRHDELPSSALTPEIRSRLISYFNQNSTGRPFLIEKTVSNCLRIPFVYAVFPDAIFVHLIRDGRDVVESVQRQWTARPDWRYVLEKARTFPILQAPGYALKYASTMLKRVLRNTERSAGTWGPRYQGIDEDVAHRDLIEVCAIQWVRSVEATLRDLAAVPADQVINVRYEDFVQNPQDQLKQIAARIGLDGSAYTS